MSKSSRKFLKKSCAWIRENWNAKNLDVPTELVQIWIYKNVDEDPDLAGFQLGVFTFGYCQHRFISDAVPIGDRINIPTSQLMELFQIWQMKLALNELNKVTDLKSHGLPLFDFPKGEQIEFWREQRQ